MSIKHQLFFNFALGLTIATCTASLVLAQPQQTLQSLLNGDYFYGESSTPDRPGDRYLIIRKTGRTIIGRDYHSETDDWYCFKGTASRNRIINVTAAAPLAEDNPKLQFGAGRPIELNNLRRLNFNLVTSNNKTNFQSCIQTFQNRR
ncbi:hypothetical protein [Argonema galeatum]|uniref:hypothetical protein n=1 Tax=Argonema galeatum TaxID=2942762 RepID=UPI002011CF53|nr:hypothetical protein [Argonema galeatum]MCL1463831.1 hypothetical protein [Argonema galeatum A003/A1]